MDGIAKVARLKGIAPPRSSYSTYTRVGDMIFIAGQVAVQEGSEEVPGNFADQLKLILENIKVILKAEGSCMENVLKTTVFLTQKPRNAEYDSIYRSYFKDGFPARSTVIVAGLMDERCTVEIEAVAWVPPMRTG